MGLSKLIAVLALVASLNLAGSSAAELQTAPQTGASQARPIEDLIDRLALIDQPMPGVSSVGVYEAFIAEDEESEQQSGLMGEPPPVVPPQARNLVRLGLAALPGLLAHLDDKRPTELMVGGDTSVLAFQLFGDEYDPRLRPKDRRKCGDVCGGIDDRPSFEGTYTVKVADICFVLIGQIVNRNLLAVRYQATGGTVVNSPIETPVLRTRAVNDWQGVQTEEHAASLMGDIEVGDRVWEYSPAFKRLRFYYPERYAGLTGANARKRAAFEAEERERR